MKKENLEMNKMGCLQGGTREACVIVREALVSIRGQEKSDSFSLGSGSAVSMEEFLEAVRVLMAFSYSKEDTVPERYECVDADCKNNCNTIFCPGEFFLDSKGNTLQRTKCPYYKEWD